MINPIEQTRAMVENETYGFVNTNEILKVFEAHGWSKVSQNVARVKNVERGGFQKHLIKLENPKFQIQGLTESNKSKPQLVLVNSHDGTTSLRILWGLFRVACLNGIIAGTGIQGVRLVHSKSIVDKLPNAIQYMLDNFKVFTAQVEALQNKTFSENAQLEFIKTVYDARLANVKNVKTIQYQLPRIKRLADTEKDAYTVFNRVQEVLVRGGIQYTYEHESGALLVAKTRTVSSVNTQIKLNQLVYNKALELAE